MRGRQVEWGVQTVPEGVEEEFEETAEEKDGKKIWWRDYTFYTQKIVFDPASGTIQSTAYARKSLQLLYLLYFLLTSYTIGRLILHNETVGGVWDDPVARVALVTAVFYLSSLPFFTSLWMRLDLEGIAQKVEEDMGRMNRLQFLVAFTLCGVFAVSVFSTSTQLKAGVVAVSGLLAGAYYIRPNSVVPTTENGVTLIASVPFLGITWLYYPILVVGMAGHMIGNMTDLEFSLMYVLLLYFVGIFPVLSLTALFVLAKTCQMFIDEFANTRIDPVVGIGRYSLFVAYLFTNFGGIVAGVIASDMLYFGITGQSFLSGKFSTLLQAEREVLYSSYSMLERIFSLLPGFSPQVYAVLFYIVTLTPVFLFVGCWSVYIVRRVVLQAQIFREFNLSDRLTSDIVPDDIAIVVTEKGTQPSAHAGSLFFGWQKFILVNRTAIEILEQDELDAVLAHELYHLENRDWQANLLANLFSVLFGGKNSLLVFYDYPKIELEADDYAAERAGTESLRSALGKIDLHRLKNNRSHDFSEDKDGIAEKVVGLGTALYDLFFGTILLDISHLSIEERQDRLQGKVSSSP